MPPPPKKKMRTRPPLKLAKPKEEVKKQWDVTSVWTKKLGKPFTPISCYFLENYHRLKYPITPIEFAFIVHLLRHKWGEAEPYPAFGTLARRIGRSPEALRAAARSLGKKGYLKRTIRKGSTNRFDLTPLFNAVEKLYDEDQLTKKNPKEKRRGA